MDLCKLNPHDKNSVQIDKELKRKKGRKEQKTGEGDEREEEIMCSHTQNKRKRSCVHTHRTRGRDHVFTHTERGEEIMCSHTKN